MTQPKTSKAGKRTRYVVAYNKRLRRWAATVKGQSRREYRTQREAITATAAIARTNQPAEIIIKGRDGVIRDNRTYGNDPRGIRG
jgi:hypothetical protein